MKVNKLVIHLISYKCGIMFMDLSFTYNQKHSKEYKIQKSLK